MVINLNKFLHNFFWIQMYVRYNRLKCSVVFNRKNEIRKVIKINNKERRDIITGLMNIYH
jgi:predicted 2-oxoglutarate/Fe(II)-dependent dioxygenase YbiX